MGLEISFIIEDEYYSTCCDAPPLNHDEVDVCIYNTGYCMKCGMGSEFELIKREV